MSMAYSYDMMGEIGFEDESVGLEQGSGAVLEEMEEEV